MGMSRSLLERIAARLTRTQKVILYLLWTDDCSSISGKTKLQKEVFLVARYIKDVWDTVDYVPHHHGAYSEAVEMAYNMLVSYELVDPAEYPISLTQDGIDIIPLIESSLSPEEKDAILEFKGLMNRMTLDEALVFHYFSFREYTTDSAIIDKVIRKRIPATVSMYRKGFINFEKALFLSGLTAKELLRKVNA